ncbi:MAG TPA: DUF3857 domain-containing protein, partial [Candidatus Krumholzibacterium sp.]|nr:DUF3857 domain-containing protein [Candidatus Krumholzibacterium sp.]
MKSQKTAYSMTRILTLLLVLLIPVPGRCLDGGLAPGDKPPADVFSRLADAGQADDHEDAGHIIVFDRAVNRMKVSGVTYVDAYTVYKVLTSQGAKDLSVLRWNYDPQSSHVEVREVNIIRDGGKIPVDPALVHDLPAPQHAIYWNDRIKIMQLPRLEIGDGIEVTVFRKGFTYALLGGEGGTAGGGASDTAPDDEQYIPPMPGEYFDIVYFSEEVPVVEKRYTLDLPAEKRLHSQVYNGPLYASTTYSGERTVYEWWGLDLPARVHEPGQPDRSDFVPKVVMATAESWEA